ncbi:tetraacyldisaccharide 4'-kinase [Flavobacterium psychrophilum FPG101]|uniref:tetraacyldisaccharide 4'-kinase n=1 Tax=Flavobacterium psychrophilum TaxID=96345 RepID=UPI0004F7C09C|nr:tetraacyldisaccharide 4'-kinase [Flavobacterium psychrophilum]AIN72117.1 tetraacyldisaccharide 4'-kinase [Flavobacterium psychrophilum FPG101]EKT4534934.1 tetraacyldisaccharide 4'-kinase [Flavobacterium psychrophilum]EKT4545409.1 tetraacyldisaccharide 4'-kinase [Flavobacterium psychrophilum]OAE93261.1 tetraacyldisaccharide 4'-kinase [Flavobacterium psychrophilum]OJH12201.1 tetraacyldisaccharide 4'-kinase [Flavobacterium psychrophilum]
MNFLRKTLFPFAILYGFITSIRNFLFDCGILKSHAFPIPVIAVGNLSVGGTGKTPQIEYLIRLLSNKYQIATLSRGYKRKSEGFILANPTSNAEILGDEPFQFYKKFPNIQVAVAANRKNGIERLLSLPNKPEIILLDDAFQHRKVKAGFYILLTAYNDLFVNDFMLPTGNLRESRSGAKRANMIIVTKCPKDISELAQNKIKEALINYNNKKAEVFFTFIDYDDKIYSANKALNVNEVKTASKLLLAGIAKPESFFAHLQSQNDECLVYPDHHHFLEKNITDIKEKAKNKIIITTEKDFVRLSEKLNSDNLFYLPIKSLFVNNEKKFDKKIINYVESSTTNG